MTESNLFDIKTVISEELEMSTRGTIEDITFSLESSCISMRSEI